MTDLSGRLSDFALSQVLTLLETGTKTGVLRVTGTVGEGSLNINDGKVVHRGDDGADLIDALVGLARIPGATFAFESGVVSVGGPDTHHRIGDLLPSLAERLSAWAEVESTIGSAHEPHVLIAKADPEADLLLSGADWNLLVSLGSGASAAGLSRSLDLDEFTTAQDFARFAALGLIGRLTDGPPKSERAPVADGSGLVEPRDMVSTPEREPDTTSTTVLLDLTGPRVDETEKQPEPEPVEDKPPSELAARWRDLRASRR